MTKQIHFLFREHLDGYVFNPHRPEGLAFFDEEASVEVSIRAGGSPQDHHYGHRNLELRATISRDVTEQQFSFVDDLLNHRTIQPDQCLVRLPYVSDERQLVAPNGKVAEGYSPTSDFLPSGLQELCISAGAMLQDNALRFIQLLRWLEDANGPDKVLSHDDPRFRLYWRTTQQVYHSIPWPKQGEYVVKARGGLTWSDDDNREFAELWKSANSEEPLGHRLLREAREIVAHNPRSALLICYSALEVGLKQHIERCEPTAGWLALNVPAPPVHKVLREYLPVLHAQKEDFQNWENAKTVFSLVRKFGEDRNSLAHAGKETAAELEQYLATTSDLLFAFDVFEGHAWAKKNVSHQFRNLMGWQSTSRTAGRMVVKVRKVE